MALVFFPAVSKIAFISLLYQVALRLIFFFASVVYRDVKNNFGGLFIFFYSFVNSDLGHPHLMLINARPICSDC
jgi:hypothetical protein